MQFCGNGQVFAVVSANHAAFLLLERSVGKFRVVCGQCQISQTVHQQWESVGVGEHVAPFGMRHGVLRHDVFDGVFAEESLGWL